MELRYRDTRSGPGPRCFQRNDQAWQSHWLSVALACVTVVPLRILAVLVLVQLPLLILQLVCRVVMPHDYDRDNCLERYYPRSPTRGLAFVHAVISVLERIWVRLIGFHRIRVDKSRVAGATLNPQQQPAFVVANHVSFTDFAVIAAVHPRTLTGIVKEGVWRLPGYGWGIQATGGICARRDPSECQRSTGVTKLLRRFAEAYHDGNGAVDGMPQMLVFPEGTTTNGDSLCRFRLGAFLPAQPVQPVAIRYRFDKFNPAFLTIPPVEWLIRLLGTISHRAEVIYLPVYHPSAKERSDPVLYARNVQHVIATALDVPTSDVSLADKMQYYDYLRYKISDDEYGSRLR